MAKLAEEGWVAERLGRNEILIVDARRPMKYLMGHLPGAINLPVYQAFGNDGRLLAPDDLAEFIGRHGLGDSRTAVLYDSPQGQNAAMLAWILEYLGHDQVVVMDAFFETWKAHGREVRYKPVEEAPARFTVRLNPKIRATLDEVRKGGGFKLIDFRSREEFSGERTIGDDTAGHIPGAASLEWRELVSASGNLLKSNALIEELMSRAGVSRGSRVIAYCRTGPRASLGYLALRQLGYDVRLFDGSYAEWLRASLPVEK